MAGAPEFHYAAAAEGHGSDRAGEARVRVDVWREANAGRVVVHRHLVEGSGGVGGAMRRDALRQRHERGRHRGDRNLGRAMPAAHAARAVVECEAEVLDATPCESIPSARRIGIVEQCQQASLLILRHEVGHE